MTAAIDNNRLRELDREISAKEANFEATREKHEAIEIDRRMFSTEPLAVQHRAVQKRLLDDLNALQIRRANLQAGLDEDFGAEPEKPPALAALQPVQKAAQAKPKRLKMFYGEAKRDPPKTLTEEEKTALAAELLADDEKALVHNGNALDDIVAAMEQKRILGAAAHCAALGVFLLAALQKVRAVRRDCIALASRVTELEARPPPMTYHGVWRSGQTYQPGSIVTCDGGSWHANIESKGFKPGTGAAWTLTAKSHGKSYRTAALVSGRSAE